MADLTTVPLTKKTRDRLKALGRKGESWDALLNRLMDERESAPKPLVSFEIIEE
ncbi:MAG TPA: hypothetical protein VNZ52_01080 [Candidatus Thermoplasmatota archaeon]|nr:hypothetical protein [Candidatus Thermoplasmatota archaeon]